jgi:alcohol dehydrogenase/L-iditol 2-dehydrogenase
MSKTMPAVVHHTLEAGGVELREHPVPEIGADDVLLAVGGVSVCGSDVHQFHNSQSWRVNVPVVLGHEFCGVVARAGGAVKGFREGDRVVSETAAVICGLCAYCRTGRYNLCPQRQGFGYGVDGAMASFVRVPSRCLHRLPDSVSFEKAALTEPCCVAYNAVLVQSHVRAGDTVVVLGPGPIGLLCLELARQASPARLLILGVPADEPRLAVARQMGAEATTVDQAADWVRGAGDGLGAALVVDATGASESLRLALSLVRPGGQITKVGWGPQPLGFSIDPLVQKAVTLQGSFSHTWSTWEAVLGLLAEGKIRLQPLIGAVLPLEKWRSAFDGMYSREIIKAVLKIE